MQVSIIITAIILSLQITAIYIVFQQGMVLGWFRIMVANMMDWLLGNIKSRYIQKPLWDCLPCMASVWTVILMWKIDVGMILIVCGINVIINKFLDYE